MRRARTLGGLGPRLPASRSLVLSEPEPEGQLLGCYKVVRELGRGTFGTVLLVRSVTGDELAMKVSRGGMARYIAAEEGFLRRLPPGVAPAVVDGFQSGEQRCLVMELCAQPLAEVAREGLPLARLKPLMRRAAAQLQAVHALNVVHADVKTDNFMLRRRGDERSLRLIDFSSALQLPRARLPARLQSRYFRAPEVLHRRPYGPAIDLWGLGCLYCELALRRPLFPSRTDEMLALQHLALLGPPPYAAPEYFAPESAVEDAVLRRYGLARGRALLPAPAVAAATGRPECEPRDLAALLRETGWPADERAAFLELARGLLAYEPAERWDCARVLACAFLAGAE